MKEQKICVIIIHDGRNGYLEDTLESFEQNVKFEAKHTKLIVCDYDGEQDEVLQGILKKHKIKKAFYNTGERLGVFKMVQKAWSMVPEDCTHIWHQENDFTFNELIDTESMIRAVNNPNVFQVALLRQAWWDNEKKKGGIYKTGTYKNGNVAGVPLVMHRNYFTFNPSIYLKKTVEEIPNFNEYSFLAHLHKKNCNGWSTFLGTMTDAPKVNHIGEEKV